LDIDRSLAFHKEVLEADVVYADAGFAVVHAHGSEWMPHSDHTYSDHLLSNNTANAATHQRGDTAFVKRI
tara:strand:- start:250 stop:459 length:210 start_codon:yes stop_codon:yes gene_type:complete